MNRDLLISTYHWIKNNPAGLQWKKEFPDDEFVDAVSLDGDEIVSCPRAAEAVDV